MDHRDIRTFLFDLVLFGYHLGLAAVVGGGFALGALAAPAIFRTLRSRAEAGTVFGAILARFDGAAITALVLVGVTSVLRARLADEDPTDPGILARWACLVLMAVATLYSSAWASPVARAIRASTPGFDDLPETDVRRVEFRRLHARSTRAFSLAVLFGIVALFFS